MEEEVLSGPGTLEDMIVEKENGSNTGNNRPNPGKNGKNNKLISRWRNLWVPGRSFNTNLG